jgi:hypothetical protein
MPLAYAGKQIQKTSVNVSERKVVSRIDAVAFVVVVDVANVMGARPGRLVVGPGWLLRLL